MSDEKSKVTDKAGEIAKNIWLAGVGAYGRAVDEAQDMLEKAGMDTPKLFKDLVKAGAALEEEARETKDTRSARSSVEERINRVRENFHMQRPARIEDVTELKARLDAIGDKVDKLAAALAEGGLISESASRGIRKKTPARKAAGKKPAGRKPAARKPAGKRTGATGSRSRS